MVQSGRLGITIVLVAWFLIGLTMILDVTMRDLFRWVGPLLAGTRDLLNKRILHAKMPEANGYTPLSPAAASAETLTTGAARQLTSQRSLQLPGRP